MASSTHAEAVASLKRVTDVCLMVVSREVLVVMPEDAGGQGEGEGGLFGIGKGGRGLDLKEWEEVMREVGDMRG